VIDVFTIALVAGQNAVAQTPEIVKAADALFGPAGVILATVAVAVVTYLYLEVKRQRELITRLRDEHMEITLEREKDTLTTLETVLQFLSRLEESDRETSRDISTIRENVQEIINHFRRGT